MAFFFGLLRNQSTPHYPTSPLPSWHSVFLVEYVLANFNIARSVWLKTNFMSMGCTDTKEKAIRESKGGNSASKAHGKVGFFFVLLKGCAHSALGA